MNTKEKIEKTIKNSLKSNYGLYKLENVNYMTNKGQHIIEEDRFWAQIQSKNEDVFWMELTTDPDDSNIILLEFREDTLKEFDDIFNNTEGVISKLIDVAYDLSFIYTYCCGKESKLDINEIRKNLIQNFYYDGSHHFFGIDIGESKVSIASEINLEKEKMIHNLYIVASRSENDTSIKCESWNEYEEFKKDVLREWAATPLNKKVEELKIEDYKLLHMINY